MLSSYHRSDLDDCMELHARWKSRRGLKKERETDWEMDRMLIEDSASAHRRALEDFVSLGLTGRVVRLDGTIVAYTFGYPLKPDTFCILVEVADLGIAGLGVYLFREFSREMKNYSTIHAMGDSGLERLRKAKLSYRPSKILTSYIATRHN